MPTTQDDETEDEPEGMEDQSLGSTDARWSAYKQAVPASERLSWGAWCQRGQPLPVEDDPIDANGWHFR